jgi:hypothetical protein
MAPIAGRIELMCAGNRANVEADSIQKKLQNSGDTG